MIFGLLLSTLLMVVTMRTHWSGLRHRPHGTAVAVVTSFLQIAAVWEMADKVISGGRPRPKYRVLDSEASQPLLPLASAPDPSSNPPKGSPGENAMRGVRKLSICNIPQAFVSLWFHMGLLIDGALTASNPFHLTVVFVAGYLSLSFGIADFVLYIWVDDVFVRRNKKLVTAHYCVEIISRLPTLAFFHYACKSKTGPWPLLSLFLLDVSGTSLLLRFARAHKSLLDSTSTSRCANFLFSTVVSAQLFFVNIVFFDPGMHFLYVNQVFYVMKYLEFVIMWRCIHEARFLRPHNRWNEEIAMLPNGWYHGLFFFCVFFVLLNAVFVWKLVPERRRQKDQRYFSPSPAWHGHGEQASNAPAAGETTRVGSNYGDATHQRQLRGLEGIFELLLLLSKVHHPKNRSRIVISILDELWLHALPWEGIYTDEAGGEHSLQVSDHGIVKAETLEDVLGSVSKGHLEMSDGRHGTFDGHILRWSDGKIWRRVEEQSGMHQDLKLILPQLAAALRWDCHTSEWPMERRVPSTGSTWPWRRPLLEFLVEYAEITEQRDFICDLYWSLVCLSNEEVDRKLGHQSETSTYRSVRFALVQILLAGATAGQDFYVEARQDIYRQREVWRQHMVLYTEQQRSGGGAAVKTNFLREVLKRLSEEPRDRVPKDDVTAEDEASLHVTTDQQAICLLSPRDDLGNRLQVSLPVDPTALFCGTVVEESEVLPSKQAPVMLVCRMQRARQSPLAAAEFASPSHADNEVNERYLLKVGDDLRQDQLMLELMSLMGRVWQAHLLPEDVRLLHLAEFRVLAVTPNAGYVKFVPHSTCLTEVLRQSRGNVMAWLSQHKPKSMTVESVMDNLCGSVAASCVVTYVLGIGDRHLENICLTPSGYLFHIDFGFVLGDDPKPLSPPVRLPAQIAQALIASKRLNKCFKLAKRAYLALRPFAQLFAALLQVGSGGAGCAKLAQQPMAAVAGVQERLRVEEEDEERAAAEFLALVRESSQGFAAVMIDKVHAAGLFWR